MHGDELQYLYDINEFADFPLIRHKYRELSLSFSQNLVKMWVNFASEGKPSGDWEPIPEDGDKSSLQWEIIGDKRGPEDEPMRDEVIFFIFCKVHIVVVCPFILSNSNFKVDDLNLTISAIEPLFTK